MTTHDPAASWLAQADADLDAARASADQNRHALACFLSHESATKAVKGFLYRQGAEIVWGEHLSDLCEDAMAFDPSFDFVKSVAALLDKHILAARNPDAIGGAVPAEVYDSTDSSHALEIATEVLDTIRQKLA
ncbi:MAG: HEPN domain-containing protein [Chloroflexi bacterium]|nr:HEPN domain-containing protein [Chloroflexota bacterium]MCH8116452.1 HEPN domain-containing protein [Chloroflexota bacterium]MCI0775206.1 HEPN domain-containing protein [Chloroflexota bacterium]MCI0805164.1 HEPN domain-containing protein [Chloroflexota bacterium]MCI0809044.1 HEPN domain-containing protein [Chloroflexota bacterium]